MDNVLKSIFYCFSLKPFLLLFNICALFVLLQVSPLSATRLATLVDESLSKEETNLESDKEEKSLSKEEKDKDKEEKSLPKDCLISNNPMMQPDRCEAGTAEDKPQRLKGGDLLNQPKLRKCENVEAGEIVKCSKRVALLHYCENDARVDLSRSAYIEGPSQMRLPHIEGPSQMRTPHNEGPQTRIPHIEGPQMRIPHYEGLSQTRTPHCEGPSQTRIPHIEGPSQMRVIRSRSAGSKPQERNCKEKPGRFEMLI